MAELTDLEQAESPEALLLLLRDKAEVIAMQIGQEVPLELSNGELIALSDVQEMLTGDESPQATLMSYLYNFILAKDNLPCPEGYGSWAEFNTQMRSSYLDPQVMGFNYISPGIRIERGFFPDESYPSIHAEFGLTFDPAGPYMLIYSDPNWDVNQNSSKAIRAYLTFNQAWLTQKFNYADTVVRFAELCDLLYKAGIYFNAKLSSPSGSANRYDNLIIYTNAANFEEVRGILAKFASQNPELFSSKLMPAAIPDPEHQNIGWGFEPRWHEVNNYKYCGFGDKPSYTSLIASKALVYFLDRLVEEHLAQGNNTEAETFRHIRSAATPRGRG